MLTVNHPWHGAHYGENAPATVNALIEIPQGSRSKYEVDKDNRTVETWTGSFILPFITRSIMVLFRKHWDRTMTRWIFWFFVPNPSSHFAW